MTRYECPVCHGDIDISDTLIAQSDSILEYSTTLRVETTYKHHNVFLPECAEFLQKLFEGMNKTVDRVVSRVKNMDYSETPTERNSHVQEPFTPSESRQDTQVVPD